MTDRIVYLNSELFYFKEGEGNKIILLFHGFGQDHRAFESWNEILQNEYTVYSFDLFFHGNSRWENQRAVEHDDWRKIFQVFMEQEKIENFELAGFSIGARFALATVELFPSRVNKVMLIAPDGIATNFWYSLATSTSLMRGFFRSIVMKPKRLLFIIKFLKFFQLENRNLLRFVELQMSTPEMRQRVYRSWVYFRHLDFDLHKLSELFNSRAIPVIFFLGKADMVISANKIIAFAKTLRNHQIQLLDAGHNDLVRKAIINLKTIDQL